MFSFFKRKSNSKRPVEDEETKGEKIESNDSSITISFQKDYYEKDFPSISIPSSDEFLLMEKYVDSGDYFLKDQSLFKLGSKIHGSGTVQIKLPFSGRIEKYHMNSFINLKFGDKLISVSKFDDESFVQDKLFEKQKQKLDLTEVSLIVDEFTDGETIKFTKISDDETEFFKLYEPNASYSFQFLGFSFVNHNGFVYLSFHSRNENFSLSKGDSIIMLFEGGVKLEFEFKNAGHGTKGARTNYELLNYDILNTFLTRKFLKLKIISVRRNLYDVYDLNHSIKKDNQNEELSFTQYDTELAGQYLLQLLTFKFIEYNKSRNENWIEY